MAKSPEIPRMSLTNARCPEKDAFFRASNFNALLNLSSFRVQLYNADPFAGAIQLAPSSDVVNEHIPRLNRIAALFT